MSNSPQTCSQCGAALPAGTDRCLYCGSALRPARAGFPPKLESLSSVSPESPRKVEPPFSGQECQLPRQFVGLKRPKAQQPLDGSGCMLVFSLFWTIFSAAFLLFVAVAYFRDTMNYNRLAAEGLLATALVTRTEIKSGDDSDSYHVYYEFRAKIQGDTARFQGADEISADYYRQLSVGQEIPIIYWASDPNLSAVKAEFGPPGVFALVCPGSMGGLFTLVGLVMLFSSITSIVNLSRLRLSGRQTQAFIFDRWTDKDSDGDTTYFIAYAFQANQPGRGSVTVTRAEQNKQAYERYQVGDPVPARYLPNDPNICQLQIEKKGFFR